MGLGFTSLNFRHLQHRHQHVIKLIPPSSLPGVLQESGSLEGGSVAAEVTICLYILFYQCDNSETLSKAAVFGKWTGQTTVMHQDTTASVAHASQLHCFPAAGSVQKYFSPLPGNIQGQTVKSAFKFLHVKKVNQKFFISFFQSSMILCANFNNAILHL